MISKNTHEGFEGYFESISRMRSPKEAVPVVLETFVKLKAQTKVDKVLT